MTFRHKNKTLAALLSFLLGAIGLHRFYLTGLRDRWGWLHFASLPASAALLLALPGQPLLVTASPLVLSALVASIETFVIGLMPDEKWDATWNPGSGRADRHPLAGAVHDGGESLLRCDAAADRDRAGV